MTVALTNAVSRRRWTPPFFASALLAAATSLGVTGCVSSTDADVAPMGDAPHVGKAEEAVAWTNTFWIGQQHGFTEPYDLGPSSDRTCFLSAVNGVLDQGGYVSVRIVDGRWKLYVVQSGYVDIGAGAVCIGNVANRVTSIQYRPNIHNATDRINLGAATANRRCFLAGVYGDYNAWQPDIWNDWVEIYSSNGYWYLEGNLPYRPSDGYSSAGADAVCVDTAYGAGVGEVAGPYSLDLYDNSSGGWACGLIGVGGSFRSYNAFNGPEVTYDARARKWRLTSDDDMTGWATCVK